MSAYSVAWLVWLGAFVGLEIPALFNRRRGDTFSEHIWRWFAVRSSGRYAVLRRLLLVAVLAWLVAHFLTGGRI
ncbi:hypothetical protein [Streptomyces sp. NBC_00519]|uniref:hypothetical protein n=1 Tax=Streptomyces sp. NBC_00519 TaxID=2975764 RepID=UPI0030E489F9